MPSPTNGAPGNDTSLESRTLAIGQELFSLSANSSMSLFDRGFWSGKMMDWSMQNHEFKVQMFRFVDVLPTLKDARQVNEHVREYFLDEEVKIPGALKSAMSFASGDGLIGKVAASTIRKNVEAMAGTFIAGENSEEALSALEKLWKNGLCFTVDILGESVVSQEEANEYQARYLELVEGLAEKVKPWKPNPLLETGPVGPLPRANVSVKASCLYSQTSSFAFRKTIEGIKDALRPIARAAVKGNVYLNLDMEQNDYRDLILTVAEELFMEDEFKSYPYFGLVIQAYLKCALDDIDRVVRFAKTRQVPLMVRLVKGAYWDYEVIKALENDWEIPVYTDKAATDANYERCTERLLDAHGAVLPAFASHNVRNLAYAMALTEAKGLPKTAIEVQMLFGMADPFKKAVAALGYRLREYVPVGEMLPGMAYLVRRLLENTSNDGFLRATFVSKEDAASLLADPRTRLKADRAPKEKKKMFKNEALRDFGLPENRAALEAAVKSSLKQFPIRALPVVAGRLREGLPTKTVTSPNDTSVTVSEYALSTVELADEAVKSAQAAMKTWGRTAPAERSAKLRKLAQLMRDKKDLLSAVLLHEVAKSGPEADGDVAEAIDFCEFYAAEMDKFAAPQDRSDLPGESNQYVYVPRGPTVVIAPWNFPLAILCGMAVGPLVCGDPVILKPAEQSSGIAKIFYDLLMDAGFPPDSVQFLPGEGESVGAHLVKHPGVHIINFTGSRSVGLWILEEANKVRPGQKHIKRAVCELGGKNALIVDEDADLDEAVLGALKSAFGFQGQKCSALSRIIVLESAYERFKERLVQGLKSMSLGTVADPATKIGAVIDAESQKRLLAVIEKHKASVIGQLPVPASLQGKGHYVPATIFESTDFSGELGQQEFFGPLVTLFKVKDIGEAIERLNGVDYALTGGVFSRSPRNIERVKQEAEVGNLYINRGITGALVSRQPFGGFKLSGVGAKAGGPDYLLQFLEPKTQTENLMRRGFAPEL
jgi:RHH-type proline utilization regulon transcriptional repressor/proline dehydrogenase/delta 1-pyrroline-5-carboxylate dehydrogenase